ncbi:MAG: lipopolysaccharide kinase InaA family protein [Gemmatimonadota bacterium]
MIGSRAPSPPPAFREIPGSRLRAWARPELEEWVRGALGTCGTLHAAARRDAGGATKLTGRAPVFVVRRGDTAWAVRRYTRGGAVASFLGDRYLHLGSPRPLSELAASEGLRRLGVPTPRILALAVYRAGPFYRADLATELVPDATDLVEFLFQPRSNASAATRQREILHESGSLVRRLAEVGGYHRDLNAKNLLVRNSSMAPRIYLIDLDRCRVGVGAKDRSLSRMAGRLRSSLTKWGHKTGHWLDAADWDALATGLGSPSEGTNSGPEGYQTR